MNRKMKRLLLFLSISFVTSQVMAQKHIYQIRADSVRIYSDCDTAELIIENRTKDTLGFLFNKGKGRTEFRKITETLASVTARGNTTVNDIWFNSASGNPSNGLYWSYNTDSWKIFAESPQDTPSGNLIFEAKDNDNEGWIFRHDGTNTAGTKIDLLSIGRDRLKYKGFDLLHTGNTNYVRGGVYETAGVDWNTFVSNSFVGSANTGTNAPASDGSWWNLISTRHRNGLTDGNNFGMQIASGMTGTYLNRIYFRSQSNGAWAGWREFWHSGNVTFGTKGAGVALKAEADGRLGLESWVRVGNNTGLTTPAGTSFYHSGVASWVLKSAPGQTVTYLDFRTGNDTISRGSVYAANDNSIGFTGGSGTNWRLRTFPNGNTTIIGQVTATAFVQSSLRSLKKDIQPFTTSATGILKNAQVRTFIFKADSTNTEHIGFIADELPKEMSAAEHKGVDQSNTVALLVKALQEMNDRVEALEQEVRRLKEEKAAGKKTK